MAFFDLTKNVTRSQVLNYMFMPQILPRLNELSKTGFSQLAYLIALVYRAVNILPKDHRLLSRDMRDNLNIRTVLAAAGAELEFSWRNADKIIIYFSIMVGLILLVCQIFLTIGFVLTNPAMAAGAMPTTYAEFFAVPNYQRDIAYRLLYSVFGVQDIFMPGVAIPGADGDGRRPFHVALHAMFQLYSVGLLVFAVIIVCYYIFAIAVETAQTGVPFGKRYNHVWTPIRLVFGLGLLIPVGLGLNSAQWITLYAAKFGSDFATRGWVIFNDVMTTAQIANPEERVARPQAPDLTSLIAFMMLVEGCEYAYENAPLPENRRVIDAYFVKSRAEQLIPPTLNALNFQDASTLFNGGDIVIRFGAFEPNDATNEKGSVKPYCGEVVVYSGDAVEPGAFFIQQRYLAILEVMFYEGVPGVTQRYGIDFMRLYGPDGIQDAAATEPPAEYKSFISRVWIGVMEGFIERAVPIQAESTTWAKDPEAIELGWGGAGIWYNKIAQLNGSLVSATNSYPQPRLMPSVMENLRKEQLQQNEAVSSQGSTAQSEDKEVQLTSFDHEMAAGYERIYEYWAKEDVRQDNIANQTKRTTNVFIDVINLIFGTRGLFNMCENADVHPLAQLSALGKGLIESTIRNLGLALGFGSLAVLPIPFLGAASGAASSFLVSIATITLTMGFTLFYVLPFMPFLYFFFAVGGWIKGLFEAMVGLPLWALAHLRIDGEGLPGDAAATGYYLILEIFLRPILIIFGLLASFIVFSAMVKVLNEIFSLVVTNVSGHDSVNQATCTGLGGGNGAPEGTIAYFRGPIDELFYTVIYAIVVYMIGMSCFKLIDLIPNNLLRYMGQNIRTFNDTASDPAQGLMGYVSVGASQLGGQAIGAIKQGGSALGSIGKAAVEMSQQK